MKQAEFLNLETKQVQWLDASLEHPNLVRVPEGAEAYTQVGVKIFTQSFYKNNFSMYANASSNWQWKQSRGNIQSDNGFMFIWQRSSLQEKINEALSILNVTKAQLSLLLGREKSYVKRLLAKGRNVTENTKAAVIDQLEQLIRVQEYEKEEPKHISKLTVQLSIDTKEVQDELKKAYGLVDQANQNAEMYRHKCEAQVNLIKWMGGLIALLLILGIAMVVL